MKMEVSVREEIEQIEMGRPHVVVIGAGATRAAFPEGDRNGLKLPLMDDLIDVLGLRELLSQERVERQSGNFEDVYGKLYQSEKFTGIQKKIEKRVYDYFNKLEINNQPTIYDHLLLSLRGKDVVATFNWDPFLVQAYQRNVKEFQLPRLLFLHGNVKIGYCSKDKVLGINGNK